MVAISPSSILHGDLISEIDGVLTVNLGATILVASASTPGDWHTVLPLSGQCSCKAGTHRVPCRHLRIAAKAMDYDRGTAKPVCRRVCVVCGSPLSTGPRGAVCGRCE